MTGTCTTIQAWWKGIYIYIYKEYEGGMVATIHVKEVNDSLYFFIIFIFNF